MPLEPPDDASADVAALLSRRLAAVPPEDGDDDEHRDPASLYTSWGGVLADRRLDLADPAASTLPTRPSANGVDDARGAAVPSLWSRLLRAATEIERSEDSTPTTRPPAANGHQHPPPGSIKDGDEGSAAMRLLRHVQALHGDISSDQAHSMAESVQRTLASPHASADEVSARLAEMLGFDQLELVADLVGQRQEAAQELHIVIDAASRPSQDVVSSAEPMSQVATRSDSDALATAPTAGKPYTPGAQVVVHTREELALMKQQRAEQRRQQRSKAAAGARTNANGGTAAAAPSLQEMHQMRMQELEANASRPLVSGASTGASSQPKYPHVFSSGDSRSTLSVFGSRFALPAGTTRRETPFYEEVTVPPPRQLPLRTEERLVPIGEMEPMCRGAFPGYRTLNRLQSAVYPLGYGTNENLLVCAPTGAGKTDVAMLTVLRTIRQHAHEAAGASSSTSFGVRTSDFKIIYVAPMKALAAEIVRKFGKRLAYLGVKVRELTGDMQLTRQEIAETQMIVTTPEKWDVVTRKPTGDGEIAQKVRLLIIDEVHLLHEDRGAVIETIVARTLRLVESSQSLIRIVGLSATLPNYVDVADFLRVNRHRGLFYFDSSFRPVPLEQHFMGIRGKPGSPAAKTNLDRAVFDKVETLVRDGNQVMVFVHARKETVKSAMTLRDSCRAEGLEQLMLEGRAENPAVAQLRRDLEASRNKELKELYQSGFGIHHAGMLRSDRTLSERLFESGLTRVLCCTSTLAWGVNLPAFAVLIKGTEVYDSSLGRFTDLSILDVLQIFGRAGRPQYEDLGVGFICTPQEKLSHYIDAVTSQHPIESKFHTGLVNALNAEAALGSVTSLRDGVTWLSYTYMFTRMKRNPLAYGMPHAEVEDDPHLGAKRLSLITAAGRRLVQCQMLTLDEATGQLAPTELGRIAARYYIGANTVETWLGKLRANMSEADVLHLVSLSSDFEQIVPRSNEAKELKQLLESAAPCQVPGGFDTSPGKANVLLQAFISRAYVDDFALVADSAYVAQNAGRNLRALLEMALSRRWAPVSFALVSMSKAVERRMWPFHHPLSPSQTHLSPELAYAIQRHADDVEVAELAAMELPQLADLIRVNDRHANVIRQAARQFPSLRVESQARTVAHDLVRLDLSVSPAFAWNERVHVGGAEPFLVWVEDRQGTEIVRWSRVWMRRGTRAAHLSFIVPVSLPPPASLNVQWVSDRWVGSDGNVSVSLEDVSMPPPPPPHQALLDLPLLPVDASLRLAAPSAGSVYAHEFNAFNATQTQAFHALAHTRSDVLLCAPASSGRTTLAELAVWRQLRVDARSRALWIMPNRSLLAAAAETFAARFSSLTGVRARLAKTAKELGGGALAGGDNTAAELIFTTPGVVLRAASAGPSDGGKDASTPSALTGFSLVVAEDLHQLDAAYELALTRLRESAEETGATTRLVATSASVADVSGLASWLEVRETALFSFSPADRSSALRCRFEGFDLAHSATLLKAMVKPTLDAVRRAAQGGRAVVFVPSRAQCGATARDLVTRMASEMETASMVGSGAAQQELQDTLLLRLRDPQLAQPLAAGVGVWHSGMLGSDRELVRELYERGDARVLVVAREACWTLPVRARLVVLMGTQYVRLAGVGESQPGGGGSGALERSVEDYTLAEILRMQSIAAGPGRSRRSGGGGGNAAAGAADESGGECVIMCQADSVAYLQRVLSSGLPVESHLLDEGGAALLVELLRRIVQATAHEEANGVDGDELEDLVGATYLGHQMCFNPSYYGARSSSAEHVRERTRALVEERMRELERLQCVRAVAGEGGSRCFLATPLGRWLWRDAEALLALRGVGGDDGGGGEGAGAQRDASSPEAVARQVRAALGGSWPEASASAAAPARGAAEDGSARAATARAEALASLRARIPGVWLSAFGVPRRARGKKGAAAAPATTTTTTTTTTGVKTEAEEGDASQLLPEHTVPLLLCSYFARRWLDDDEGEGEGGGDGQAIEGQGDVRVDAAARFKAGRSVGDELRGELYDAVHRVARALAGRGV